MEFTKLRYKQVYDFINNSIKPHVTTEEIANGTNLDIVIVRGLLRELRGLYPQIKKYTVPQDKIGGAFNAYYIERLNVSN